MQYNDPSLFLDVALRAGIPAQNGIYIDNSSVCRISRINDIQEDLPITRPPIDIAAAKLIEQVFLPGWSTVRDETVKQVNKGLSSTLTELQSEQVQWFTQNPVQPELREYWDSLS